VRRGFQAVRLDPGDLGLEQRDPVGQFGLRIRVKAFARQPGGGIVADTGAIIVIHRKG